MCSVCAEDFVQLVGNVSSFFYLEEENININEIIIKNIHNYLKKKNISYEAFIFELKKEVPQKTIEEFFVNKKTTDDISILVIAISKVLGENLDYFCISHIEDESLSIEQEKLLELMQVCNQSFDIELVNVNVKLTELTRYALDNELISLSKASYYLNCSIEEVMNI